MRTEAQKEARRKYEKERQKDPEARRKRLEADRRYAAKMSEEQKAILRAKKREYYALNKRPKISEMSEEDVLEQRRLGALAQRKRRLDPDIRAKMNAETEAWRKEQRKSNPEYVRKLSEKHFKRAYGISIEQRDALLAAQGGRCKLCSIEISAVKGFNKSAHVDHCHKTNRVRGILCGNCNTSLGKLGDSEESIQRVLLYLRGEL